MRPGTDRERIGGGARVSLGISFSAQLWARPDLTEGRPCSIRLAARAPLEAGREHVADERPQLPAFAVDTQAIVPAAPGSGERRHGELWSSSPVDDFRFDWHERYCATSADGTALLAVGTRLPHGRQYDMFPRIDQ